MKKAMVILMMILVISMATVANAGYWDDKTVKWLNENTIDWCNKNGYVDWTDFQHYNDDMILGYGVTKDDGIFYDATPSTIMNRTYITRIEETFNTTVHSIELIHCGQEGGYDIYRLIIKWNDPIKDPNGNYVYGEDVFVRFYN